MPPYTLPSDQEHAHQPTAPTVGRFVHHVAQGSADGKYQPVPRPALVTSVINQWTLNLTVFPDGGLFFYPNAPYHPGDPAADNQLPWPVFYRDPHDGRAYPPGTWHWPPRV